MLQAAWDAGWDGGDEIVESDEVSQDLAEKQSLGHLSRDHSFLSRNDKSEIVSEKEWVTEVGDEVSSVLFTKDGTRSTTKRALHRSETTG